MNHSLELLAPAGSLEAGLAAFEAGADAIYLGLPQFSARKGAMNCSLEDLRKLKTRARAKNASIYLALNTVITEPELSDLLSSVQEAQWAGADAFIVQDVGIAYLLKKIFPNITLHASTQMAIHNAAGLREAKRLGISRVVLSRECGGVDVKRLREQCPEMELEVFIHGALCYSFSGVCLASGMVIGRSGNRGECAQLCRSWYQSESGKRYSFSCNDLALEEDVNELKKIGVHSLKIEGRMKGPEYVYHTVKLYRNLLDRPQSLKESQKEFQELIKNAALTFQRKKTKAYFHHSTAENLMDPSFPGHRGIELGPIEKISKINHGLIFELRLKSDLSRHDGIQWFPGGNALKAAAASVRSLKVFHAQSKNWKNTLHALAGDWVRLQVYCDESIDVSNLIQSPLKTPLFQIMSTDLKTPYPNPQSLKPWKTPLGAQVTLQESATASLQIYLKSIQGVPVKNPLRWQHPIILDASSKSQDFLKKISQIFSESGESHFQIQEIKWQNSTSRTNDKIFVPPSELKKVKNSFYLAFQEWILRNSQFEWPLKCEEMEKTLPLHWKVRKNISPVSAVSSAAPVIPFFCEEDFDVSSEVKPALWNGMVMIPLSPIFFDETFVLQKLRDLLSHSKDIYCFGVNNISQLEWVRRCSEEFGAARVQWWLDAYFYAANSWVLKAVLESLGPSVCCPQGVMPWIEEEGYRDEFQYFPLMISLGCTRRHSQEIASCPPRCQRHGFEILTNHNRKYGVRIKNCRTYIFKI